MSRYTIHLHVDRVVSSQPLDRRELAAAMERALAGVEGLGLVGQNGARVPNLSVSAGRHGAPLRPASVGSAVARVVSRLSSGRSNG